MVIQRSSKLVFIGDSVTDCDRGRPVGEAHAGVGNGYVLMVSSLLEAACPEHGVRVVNVGTSGNTVRDLAARWKTDVTDLAPDWLSVMIGINDVWRHFDTRLAPEWQVPLPEYERTLEGLVSASRPRLKGIVLMTPYMIEPNRADPMRAMMDSYGEAVRRVAGRTGAVLVDLQAAFDEVTGRVHSYAYSCDRIHPNASGHMVIARALLKAVGFTW